ncbi:unnamed protein product [Cladocopium goreaui]|uniref:Checkpoint protein hus1 n=1 Tax=Cladocopium goreaui TaxID=2562237 RepID=A0A9P1FI01_9DINO|nr:unnamed protein product [Cladocopium goreaui]
MASGAALEGGWFKTVQPNKDPFLEGLLQMKVEVKELLPTGKPRGFWVEAQLEVPQPLNYTLSFQHEVATDAKLPATRLPANVPVPSNLSQADFAYFTFQAGKAASHLCLRQCFGQVELQLELNGSDVAPKVEDENPIALRGNCTAVTGRADGAISSVLVRKVSVAPSNFEIELTTRADERIQLENPVLNVSDFKLCDASRIAEANSASPSASPVLRLGWHPQVPYDSENRPGLASEPTLRYEVLAMWGHSGCGGKGWTLEA